jgi:hypothetical protein
MPRDVLITPGSGIVEFKDDAGTVDAAIELDGSGNLNITNPGGDLNIGNLASDVYIGDGVNSVDIIFEQNGDIRALTGKTLTLGQSDSSITVASPTTFNLGVTITGDLTVNGTTTTINSTTISVDDKNIELGSVAVPSNTTADGGGITLKGATDKTLNWVNATSAWTSSEDFNLLTGKVYEINGTSVLSASTLGSGVTASSLTSVGTVTSGTWSASFGAVSGANLTTLNASNLSSGTVATARLGTGTANATTWLRGDGSWQSISGLTGATGPTGATGAQGIQGASGSTGTAGVNGATGTAGTNGATGIAGATGTAGTNGTNGATGTAGTNGATGVTGASGVQGIQGASGSTGPTGAQGASGATGTAGTNGTNGATGTAGTNGATGPVGATGAGSSLTVTDDTSTNSSFYPIFEDATSGTFDTVKVSSTKLYFNPSTGTLNATVFNSLSDIKYKDNITIIPDSLQIIDKLDGVSFTWKETGNKSYGVIAQDIEKILPELVDGDDIKSVNYSGIIAILINAIKEQQKQINELKQKIFNT